MRIKVGTSYVSKYDGWYIRLIPSLSLGMFPATMDYTKSVWMSIEWLLWDVQITWGEKYLKEE